MNKTGLVASIATSELTSAMRQQLMSATFFALESSDDPDSPMTLSATFPAAFADPLDDHETTDDGKITLGPWIPIFSSRAVVTALSADPILGVLVTQIGHVRTYPARHIFRSALDRQVDVFLNPFFGVSRSFTQDEIRNILDSPATPT